MNAEWKPDLVIYHGGGCADGFGAAWACWRRWGSDCAYLAANYGEAAPDIAGKHVLIVDFSYKDPVLRKMGEEAASVIILDHHETAQGDLESFRLSSLRERPFEVADVHDALRTYQDLGMPPVVAYFDMKRSGVRLAWEFCHGSFDVPLLVQLIEDRDLWLFRYEATRPFATWLRSEQFDFERWLQISFDIERPYGSRDIMREAEAMQRFHDAKVQEIAAFARRRVLAGHLPVVVNCPPAFASEVGNYLLDRHPDAPFAATYFDTGNKRMWSLRSAADREAVSSIAAQFGGGGHRNAAGFSEERDELLLWPS